MCHQFLTKDSVTVNVDGVVYFRVFDPICSVANVSNAYQATQLLAQTTLRNVLGTKNLSELLSDREGISNSMQVQATSSDILCNITPKSNTTAKPFCGQKLFVDVRGQRRMT